MKKARETLWLSLVAIVLLLSLWWWERGDDVAPLPVEPTTVANGATSPTVSPANTGTPEPERSTAVDAAAPPSKAAAMAPFDVLVVDAATQQPVADAEACWSDAATREQVKKLPKEQAREFWDGAERMAQQFGRRARSDREGRLRVVGDKDGCHVFARAGDRYGELVLSAYGEQPEGGHRLLMRREEHLRVRVLDAAGQPAPRARVGLSFGTEASSEANPSYDSYAATDAAGVATFAHLQQLRSSHSGPSASHATTGCAVGIAIPGLPATPVVVAPSQPLPKEPIELRLPPTGSLRVRCTVASVPMHGLDRVRVHEGAESPSKAVNLGLDERVDDDGWAWFRWLPADVPLFATPAGINVSFLMPSALPGLVVGELVEHHVDFVDVAIVLRGRLLDPAGVPMANTSLRVQYGLGGGGAASGLRTDAQGVFQLVALKPQDGKEAWPLRHFEVVTLDRQELRLSLPPREVVAGINELGDLHFGGEPLVCAGRLEGYRPRMWGAQMVLEREELAADSGTRSWTTLQQPQVGVGSDGVFEARGRVEPGRYRLRIVARDHLPVAPVEFRLGQRDLVVPMEQGAGFELRCQLPAKAEARQLVFDLVGGTPPPTLPLATARGDAPAEHRRALVHPLPNEAAGARWDAVEPGTYTLRVALLGWAEPLLEVPAVVVPSPTPQDPRLSPLDLRPVLRRVTLQLVDAAANEIPRDGFAFSVLQAQPEQWMGTLLHAGNACVLLPRSAQRLLVANRGRRPASIVVPGEVEQFSVRLEEWPSVDLALADGDALPEGCELHVTARAQRPRSNGTFGVASGIGPLGDIEGLLQPNLSVAVLRRGTASATVVVGDGPSVLSMKLQRGDRQQRLQRFTPGEVVAGAPVTITLDADELAAAAAALAAPEKAK
jgi:hypothetical protein